eukprot:SAG11_NODE_10441_length_831_cov_1.879781_1_plen_49_part_01
METMERSMAVLKLYEGAVYLHGGERRIRPFLWRALRFPIGIPTAARACL